MINHKILSAGFLGSALLVMSLSHFSAEANTFRWTSQGDVLTMDPHSQNEGLNNSISDQVYEPLVNRDKNLVLEPCLAVSWQQINPTTLRFKLRPNVVFHDGATFSADDVVFSILRALEKTSDFSAYMEGITTARKIDALTVDIITTGPNPVLLDQLTEVRIMNKAWAEKHNALKPQDFKNKEETFTARNANGTGPFILKAREPDVKTSFSANPKWWGKMNGSVTELVYSPIKSDATRIAALLNGDIDFVLDPPVQDVPKLKENPALKIIEGNETRSIFVNFDQGRSELLYSNIKGKNPFRDIRVRQAIAHTIDADAIRVAVMRGLALTSMSLITAQIRGYSKAVENRWPVDLAKAKKLMVEAGYPNGFEVTFDCPNNRYINDEKICIAIAGMLAKIDIKVKVNAMPRALFFPKVQTMDSSMYLYGWGVPTMDSLDAVQSLLRTRGKGSDGNNNYTGYSNPKLDALVDKLKTETDTKKRTELTRQILLIDQADVGHIILHHQIIPWAMRKNASVPHRADNRMNAKWVVLN